MDAHGFLFNALLFLSATVVAVPISKKLGFGAILGYLVAGILLGPSGFRFVTNVEDMLHFSEFGVVLLLFLIGMELDPKKLWQMRTPILGMGGLQVVFTAILFAALGFACGFSFQIAFLAGMGFALSSTAISVQILNEKKILGTESGRSAFSILLFQDIAVIAMIALLPLLASQQSNSSGSLLQVLKAILVLLFALGAGHFLLRPILRFIASLHLREVFTALSLLLVVAMSALMQQLQLSMGLGAFAAGLLLANSEYRHALETDIEPFKGLLLGLFFISVGMSVDLATIRSQPGFVFSVVLLLIALKFAVHFGIGRAFHLPKSQVPLFSLLLSQVGEFAFVLFGAGRGMGIIDEEQAQVLIAISAVSMFLSPILIKIYDQFFARFFEGKSSMQEDVIENADAPVIIAGFGRVGQIVGRFLFANGIKATVLDFEPDQIELLRKFGMKVYYGDATRLDLLESAGAARAKVLVVAIDEVESNLALVDMAQKNFPHLKIVCRSRNVAHSFELMARGVSVLERETFDSSLRMGRAVLEEMGVSPYQTYSLAQKFRRLDIWFLGELFKERGNDKVRISKSKQAREDIERMFAQEDQEQRLKDEAWSVYEKE